MRPAEFWLLARAPAILDLWLNDNDPDRIAISWRYADGATSSETAAEILTRLFSPTGRGPYTRTTTLAIEYRPGVPW